MPTYEYVCRNCGHGFEIVQSMRDEPLTICDVCGGELRKVFAAPAISFKGSGFYATDHGKRKASESSEKTDTKSEKKADAKKNDAGASTSSDLPASSGSEKTSSDSGKPSSPKKEPSSA
jgi:putative FmdB family regulatory protein